MFNLSYRSLRAVLIGLAFALFTAVEIFAFSMSLLSGSDSLVMSPGLSAAIYGVFFGVINGLTYMAGVFEGERYALLEGDDD